MFIGHFALAFAARRAVPRVGLGTLFAAAQLPDLVWPVLVAAGIERVRIAPGDTAFTPLAFESYPWSHSLLLVAAWATAVAVVHRLRGGRGHGGVVLASLVVSHWALDFVSHRPDLPIVPGGALYGLGLWQSLPATIAVETSLLAVGVWIYSRVTRPRSHTGRWALASLVAVLLVAYAGNVLGGPPPSIPAVWTVTLVGLAILIVLASWVDRTRVAR